MELVGIFGHKRYTGTSKYQWYGAGILALWKARKPRLHKRGHQLWRKVQGAKSQHGILQHVKSDLSGFLLP